jgi:hypothetical protein
MCETADAPMVEPRSPAMTLPYPLPHRLAARMVNAVLTAQVQVAYACATAAARNAAQAADCVERSWPDTPLRTLFAQGLRARAREREDAARNVLAGARRSCGLAYARLTP